MKIKSDIFTGQDFVNLYDLNGVLLHSISLKAKQDQCVISTTNLKTGVYILVLEVAGKQKDFVKIAVIK